jgi:hypothetical protein
MMHSEGIEMECQFNQQSVFEEERERKWKERESRNEKSRKKKNIEEVWSDDLASVLVWMRYWD